MTSMDDVYLVAVDAARAGADAISKALADNDLVVHDKGSSGHDLVTNVDRASESAIIDVIRARRSHDAILAEESGETIGTSGVRWVIDPLDGTTNLAHGGQYFGVSVAAESGGEVITAVVHQPERRLWLSWGPEGLSTSGGRIGVRLCRDPTAALLSFAVPYDGPRRREAYLALSDVAPHVRDLRNFGSTVCDLLAVATGDLDGFIGFGQQPWDTAAGLKLVEAAGGVSRSLRRRDGWDVVVAGSAGVVDAVVTLLHA